MGNYSIVAAKTETKIHLTKTKANSMTAAKTKTKTKTKAYSIRAAKTKTMQAITHASIAVRPSACGTNSNYIFSGAAQITNHMYYLQSLLPGANLSEWC